MKIKEIQLKGLTLIELIIVTFVIGAMSVIVLLNFNVTRQQKQVETAVREVASVLREAQNYSLSGAIGIPGTQPCAYRVSWSGTAYSIAYRYYNTDQNRCNLESALKSYTLKNGVSFTDSNNVLFDLPYADANSNRTIGITKGSYIYSVCVTRDGRISEVSGTSCP